MDLRGALRVESDSVAVQALASEALLLRGMEVHPKLTDSYRKPSMST